MTTLTTTSTREASDGRKAGASTRRYATAPAQDPFNLVRIAGRGGAVALQVDWSSLARLVSSSTGDSVKDDDASGAAAPVAAAPAPDATAPPASWIAEYLTAAATHRAKHTAGPAR